jgi:hypothetical protein
VDSAELLKALAEIVARQRGYAGFFDWPDERQKDLGLLTAFEEGAARVGVLVSGGWLEEEGRDPPDAWVHHENRRVAVEFTEFVDQTMIEKRKRTGEFQWRFWTLGEVAEQCRHIIQRKDHAGFGVGVSYWLVIHCDEPALNAATLAPYLEVLPAFRVRGIDRCFFLLSYEPEIESYPVLELRLERAV